MALNILGVFFLQNVNGRNGLDEPASNIGWSGALTERSAEAAWEQIGRIWRATQVGVHLNRWNIARQTGIDGRAGMLDWTSKLLGDVGDGIHENAVQRIPEIQRW